MVKQSISLHWSMLSLILVFLVVDDIGSKKRNLKISPINFRQTNIKKTCRLI